MSVMCQQRTSERAQSFRWCIQERVPNNYVFRVKLRNILVCQSGFAKYLFVVLAQQPSYGERPVFGGRGVGIGFSGTYDGEGAECEATALAGKRSIRFRAVLRKLVAA